MSSIRLRLSRMLGDFWWRRRAGWYGRFVESAAYPFVMDFLNATGLAFVLIVLGFAVLERTLPALGWSAVAILLYLFAVALLSSFGASVTQRARHEGSLEEAMDRARELLANHGFVVLADSPHRIRAVRGTSAGADSNWRGFPLEIEAAVAATDGASELSVRCTGESGRHRFIRALIERTALAIAKLDAGALQALDPTLVRRTGALLQGGLGTSVLAGMLFCAVLGTALFTGTAYLLGTYLLSVAQSKTVTDDMRQAQLQLTAAIDVALRAEADRLAGAVAKGPVPPGAAIEAVRTLAPFNVPGEFLAGVADARGRVVSASATGPQWTQDALDGARRLGLARLGNAVVRELPPPHARELEVSLGLRPGQLLIGASLAHADLARLAPARMDSDHVEITFFDSTRSFLRYAWHPGRQVQVDAGASVLPADVLASAERRLDNDWLTLLRDVFLGADVGGIAIRNEVRDGTPYQVYYSVTRRAGDAWDGVSLARVHEPTLETGESILPLAIALGLIAFMPLLIVTVVLASTISDRISRPALQLRGALRSIGEGDYSVRLRPVRADEIGQMQDELSKAAEQLQQRDADKAR